MEEHNLVTPFLKMKTICFISLGCPRNLVDSEVMLGIAKGHKFKPTVHAQDADVVVINTCGFLKSAKKESIDTINSIIKSKKKNAKVIASGCLVGRDEKLLHEECPGLFAVVGSGDISSIFSAIEKGGRFVGKEKSFLEDRLTPRFLATPSHYAFLKIAEGCCKRCAFCTIPSIKGRLKSKPLEQVIYEAKKLIDGGVTEIIFIAQDLGDWGKDFGYKGSKGLVHLLKELLQQEKRNFSLRLLYLYPDEIDEELIDCITSDPRILHYVDMPIQHISDTLLHSMRRTTSQKQIIDVLNLLRKKIPDIVIRTSIIVGFPGETEEDVLLLEKFLTTQKLDHVGFFSYSQEEETPAYSFPNQIDEKTKNERLERLVTTQQKIVMARNKKFIGKVVEVTIDGFHKDSELLLSGRMYGQCPEVDSEVIINEFSAVCTFGKKYHVEITGLAGYDLVGKVLN